MKNDVAIVIVTFNRKELILKNLTRIFELKPSRFDVVVFDNGSTDQTKETVQNLFPKVIYIESDTNIGGAGGFAKGMEYAFKENYEYIWCLDDDGVPDISAFSEILTEINKHSKLTVFGTKIIPTPSGEKDFWPILGAYNKEKKIIEKLSSTDIFRLKETKEAFATNSVALLGLFLHRDVISKIGYPNINLFLSNDDVDFCLRAWTNGLNVIQVQKSIIRHPPMKVRTLNFGFRKIDVIIMPAWKLYYFIRNNIAVNKLYFSKGTLIRLYIMLFITFSYSFLTSNEKGNVLKYGSKGFKDGFNNKLGKL